MVVGSALWGGSTCRLKPDAACVITCRPTRRIQNASEDCAQTVQNARELSNQRNVLSALQFHVLDQRFQEVATAADNTYSWILDGQDVTPSGDFQEHESKLKAVQLVDEWLRKGDGVLHISGKPGAGKSTLMKFLCEHETTYKKLGEWVGDVRKLVLGKFFFWRQGTPLQKSLSGLKRALLHSILKQCPEFIETIFPPHWDPSEYQPGIQPPVLSIDNKEISDGINQLLCSHDVYSHQRLSLFIDGLDEFEDDHQSHHDLLDAIMEWVDSSRGCLKLCVSSREDRVFMERFRAQQRFRLHELNAADILAVIKQGLFANPNFQGLRDKQPVDCDRLIRELARKSEGVFLWVILVIRNVVQSLECHDSRDNINKKVDLLPRKLHNLFTTILTSIPESQLSESCCTLAYALVAARLTAAPGIYEFSSWQASLCSLPQFSFLDEYMQSSSKSIQRSGMMGDEEMEQRLSRSAAQLLARSRNLLTVSFEGFPHGYFYFIHRSIPEFLVEFLQPGSAAYQHLLDSNDHFNALAVYLDTLRRAVEFGSYRFCDDVALCAVAGLVSSLKALTEATPTYFTYLDAIDTELLKRYQCEHDRAKSVWERGDTSVLFFWPLYMASDYGIPDYVLWKVPNYPQLLTGREGFCLAVSIVANHSLPRFKILAKTFFYRDLTRMRDSRSAGLQRLRLLKQLMDMGLDLNHRAPGAEVIMWVVVINHLIQFPHALAWELVRLFSGEHSYEIERWDIRPDRLRVETCLKQMDGLLVNLRSFLTCDSESCTYENQKGTDADGGSRTENGKGEKTPPRVRFSCHRYGLDPFAVSIQKRKTERQFSRSWIKDRQL